jgi:SAM-dependent methyltransferase
MNRTDAIKALGYDYEATAKQKIRDCNLCGADDWVFIVHRDRYGFAATATSCRRCGLTMLNPAMTPESYTHFYKEVYRPLVSAYHGRLIDQSTIQDEQREYADRMADFIHPFLIQNNFKNFLDVGGSTGIIAAEFARRFNLKATVIDPAPDEAAVAEDLGIETVVGFVEDWQPTTRYDVVGVFQTIDHLLDVGGTLAKLRSLINDQGLLVVDIVDFRAAYLRNASVESGIKIDHVYSLTESTMEAYLARHGFRILRKSYAADHLHVGYICRPCDPAPETIPDPGEVKAFFNEIRRIQNEKV